MHLRHSGTSPARPQVKNQLKPGEKAGYWYKIHLRVSDISVPARISTQPIIVFKLRVSTVPFEFGIIIAKNAANTGSAVNINAVWVGVVCFCATV